MSEFHYLSSRTCFGICKIDKDSEINLPTGQAGSEWQFMLDSKSEIQTIQNLRR